MIILIMKNWISKKTPSLRAKRSNLLNGLLRHFTTRNDGMCHPELVSGSLFIDADTSSA